MFLRKYWLLISVFLVAIVGVSLYVLTIQTPQAPVKIYKAVEPIEKPIQAPMAEVPVGEIDKGGHFHADGTWHAELHDQPQTQPTKAGDTSESGHWSEAYLPPMEELEVKYANDSEAMFILERVKVLLEHEKNNAQGHNPEADKAFAEMMNFMNKKISLLGTEVSDQRLHELTKLHWFILDNPPSTVIFENEGGVIE